jgi:hypothetical protein
MFNVYPLFKRGEIIQRKIKGIQIGGETPRRMQVGGATPRGEWTFSIDVKGGELITLT